MPIESYTPEKLSHDTNAQYYCKETSNSLAGVVVSYVLPSRGSWVQPNQTPVRTTVFPNSRVKLY